MPMAQAQRRLIRLFMPHGHYLCVYFIFKSRRFGQEQHCAKVNIVLNGASRLEDAELAEATREYSNRTRACKSQCNLALSCLSFFLPLKNDFTTFFLFDYLFSLLFTQVCSPAYATFRIPNRLRGELFNLNFSLQFSSCKTPANWSGTSSTRTSLEPPVEAALT